MHTITTTKSCRLNNRNKGCTFQVRDGKRVLDADLADGMPPEKQRKFAKKIAEYEEDPDYDPNAPSSSSSSDSDF